MMVWRHDEGGSERRADQQEVAQEHPIRRQIGSTTHRRCCGVGRNYVHLLRPFERAVRALCVNDVRAERAPRDRGVHEPLRSVLGVRVAHFR